MSRIIFLVLVLANLGWFGWDRFLADSTMGPVSRNAADIAPRLVLAGEVASDEEQVQEEVPEVVAEPVSAVEETDPLVASVTYQRCVSLGPFRSLSEASGAMTALTEVGYAPNQRIAEGEVWAGFHVSITGYEGVTEVRGVLSDLKSRGITDAYKIPGTEPPYTIALGVFSTRIRAQNRAREIRGLGYSPAVTERTRAGSVYWLDIVLGDSGFINPADFESESGRILSLQIQACPVDLAG